jgi:catechol 2,3-dioxygenase-like lactoylglutathione lyase family enzyme
MTMSIRRVVPDISSDHLNESRQFYADVLGLEVVMDLGWVVTLASPTNPTAQITIMKRDGSARLQPQVTVEVTDVDAVFNEAVRRGARVVFPPTDESWGVRRFFVLDPNDVVINVMSHHSGPPDRR